MRVGGGGGGGGSGGAEAGRGQTVTQWLSQTAGRTKNRFPALLVFAPNLSHDS